MRPLLWAARFDGEPELARLRDFVASDRIAIDVGAADGVYTRHLTRIATSCVAFEPNQESAQKIRRRIPAARVESVALSSSEKTTTLFIPCARRVPMPGLATIETQNPITGSSEVAVADVRTATLDSYEFSSVGFIKIDVEGHELAVLQGSEKTIARYLPVLLIECEDRHRPDARSSVVEWLRQRGYGEPETFSSQNMLFRPRPS